MGGPKALLRDAHGVAFLGRAVGLLLDGGCDLLTVVLGASAPDARLLLQEAGWSQSPVVEVVVAEDWADGMAASLRCGLTALSAGLADVAVVSLVDLPDVDTAVVRRVLTAGAPVGRETLVRATYDGRPGHPVLIGREHWDGVVATTQGDHGAREYLLSHGARPCECGDLATGRDLDHPHDLTPRPGPPAPPG